MRIIIVGCGNVGTALAEQLSEEGHDLTVIDSRPEVVQNTVNRLDVRGIVGNGASRSILLEAGGDAVDLLIAVTGSDELNLLCCLFARETGHCNTIASVSDPIYNKEIDYIREALGISMIINP
jgi:trk system potassium uptake protein TrkA